MMSLHVFLPGPMFLLEGWSLCLVPCSFWRGLCPGRVSVQWGLCHGRSLSWGSLSRGFSAMGGLCPGGVCCGGSLSRGISVQGVLCPEGSLSRRSLYSRVSVQGVGSLSWGSLSRGLCPEGLCHGGLCPGGSLSRGGRSLSKGLDFLLKIKRFRKNKNKNKKEYVEYINTFHLEYFTQFLKYDLPTIFL